MARGGLPLIVGIVSFCLLLTALPLPPSAGQSDQGGPMVSITAPEEGDEVNGTVEVTGTASDGNGTIDHVEVRIDAGSWQAAEGAATWQYTWETAESSPGERTLEARAWNGTAYSPIDTVNVTVTETRTDPGGGPGDRPGPTVSIDQPSEGETLEGQATITGTASSSNGTLERVEVRAAGGPWSTANGTTAWETTWNTSEAADGDHAIQARAWNGTAYVASDRINVTVDNPQAPVDEDPALDPPVDDPANAPPTIELTAPAEMAELNGTVNVTGNASDPEGELDRIEVRIDNGSWHPATGTTTWWFHWETTEASDTAHRIFARAVDQANATATTEVNVTVRNPLGARDLGPRLTLTRPEPGQIVSGTVLIEGTASSPINTSEVTSIQVGVGQRFLEVNGTSPWNLTLDTTTLPDGHHVIEVRAQDTEGGTSSLTFELHVANGDQALSTQSRSEAGPAPGLEASAPQDGATADGAIFFRGVVQPSEAEGPYRAEIRVDDGPWWSFEVVPNQPFSHRIDLTGLSPGVHELTLRAHDGQQASQPVTRTITVPSESALSVPGPGLAGLLTAGLAGLGLARTRSGA